MHYMINKDYRLTHGTSQGEKPPISPSKYVFVRLIPCRIYGNSALPAEGTTSGRNWPVDLAMVGVETAKILLASNSLHATHRILHSL